MSTEHTVEVPAGCEASFLCPWSEDVVVTLVRGECDSFGAPLEPATLYVFKNKTNVSLYSVRGCELCVSHSPSVLCCTIVTYVSILFIN